MTSRSVGDGIGEQTTPGGRCAALVRELALLVAALAVSVVMTMPLAWSGEGVNTGHLLDETRFHDQTLDDVIIAWNCWWIDQAIMTHHTSPLYCNQIFVPNGHSLVVSPLTLPLGLAGIPALQALGPLHGAMVVIKCAVLLSFVVAIHSMSLLLRRLGVRSWMLVFLAGCVFAFAPFRMIHIPRVHYLAGALMPYVLVALINGWESPRRWRPAAWGGGVLALCGWMDPSQLMDVVWLSSLFALAILFRRMSSLRAVFVATAKLALVGCLLLSPLLVPVALEMRSNVGTDVVSDDLEFHYRPNLKQLTLSPDLNNLAYYLSPELYAALVADDSAERVGSRAVSRIYESFMPPPSVPWWGAGVATATVIAVSIGVGMALLRGPGWWPLALLAVIGVVLALGPYRAWGSGSIRMPFYYLAEVIPGMKAGRYTATYLRLFLLATAVLGALGWWRWTASSRSRRHGMIAAFLVLLGAAVGARAVRPLALQPVELDSAYFRMAADPVAGSVLELPYLSEMARRKTALGQIVHGRPQVNGPLTRVDPEAWAFHRETPLVAGIEHARQVLDPTTIEAEVNANLEALEAVGARYLLLRRSLWIGDPRRRGWIERYLALHPGFVIEPTDRGDLLVTIAEFDGTPR